MALPSTEAQAALVTVRVRSLAQLVPHAVSRSIRKLSSLSMSLRNGWLNRFVPTPRSISGSITSARLLALPNALLAAALKSTPGKNWARSDVFSTSALQYSTASCAMPTW